jgi:CHASE3 domain sensor protein
MSDINSLLNDMQQRFNPNAAAGLDAIFQSLSKLFMSLIGVCLSILVYL